MEILMGIMLAVGLVMHRNEPRHLQVRLSDGTTVLMRVRNSDGDGRRALARVKEAHEPAAAWIED